MAFSSRMMILIPIKGKPREFYSYPLLKSEMNKAGLTVHTPSEENSWKYCKLDHIIGNIPISNVCYSWRFLENPDYQNKVGFLTTLFYRRLYLYSFP